MRQDLSFDEFKELAKEASRVAVFKEIPAEKLTPIIIYSHLNNVYKDGVMFENLQPQKSARYSFLGFELIESLKLNHVDHHSPFPALRHLQSQLAYKTRSDVAELMTSSMGFITYDAVRCFETIPDQHPSDPLLPALLFNFYSTSVAFDHEQQTILIGVVVNVSDQPAQTYTEARQRIQRIIQLLSDAVYEEGLCNNQNESSRVAVDTSDNDFMRMVEKAKEHIIRGNAFQIVLSRCFKRRYTVSPLTIYKTLREVSPSPFMFYFPTESSVIIGASPERFIRVHNQCVTVNPIAGTRKRTGERTDQAIADDLLSDKKEVAEHMMLVDLARNDVGAVCEPGSVQVDELLQVKHYSHLSHITSIVTGRLQTNKDALDAFAAAFPAGTLSGAPKIRAMQIIDELETSRRGLYGGAICRFDAAGNFDSCIAIRMAILQNGIATVRTGAGIVYDSIPAAEAQETHHKARSMLAAIAAAHGE